MKAIDGVGRGGGGLLLLATVLPCSVRGAEVPPPLDRCAAPTAEEATLGYDDFRWGYGQADMATRFAEIYHGGKRLIDRARWNADAARFELLHRLSRGERAVPLSNAFIDNVRSHVERALELGYAEHVFFPDMSHAHLLIPQRYYDDSISPIPPARQHEIYARLLAHPGTRFLYHTAEQLRMLDDRRAVLADKYLGWRYFTRNLVGRNDASGVLDIHVNLDSIGNTVCDVPGGYRYWGAGFHVSASADGCFTYTHEGVAHGFDISLSDLPQALPDEGWLAGIGGRGDARHGGAEATLWGALACIP